MQKENPRSSLPRSARSLAGQPSFLHLPELLAFGVHVTCMCAQKVSCVRLFGTPCTVAHQAPLSMELPRQEYWSGLPFLTPLYAISKVFSCVLQENQGELCILHLVWNWNADGFWNHHMRELPCCFQLSVGIKCENLIRRLQCWIKSGGTPPALSHYQTQGILEASLAHMLPQKTRMSSSSPGVRASLLWACLSYLAHHPWLPPSFSFWKPEADLSPCMSCPWTCAMRLPHCLLICVPMIWGEVLKSLSQRPLYLFLRLQASPGLSSAWRLPWGLNGCEGGSVAGNWALEARGWKGCVWSHLAS